MNKPRPDGQPEAVAELQKLMDEDEKDTLEDLESAKAEIEQAAENAPADEKRRLLEIARSIEAAMQEYKVKMSEMRKGWKSED